MIQSLCYNLNKQLPVESETLHHFQKKKTLESDQIHEKSIAHGWVRAHDVHFHRQDACLLSHYFNHERMFEAYQRNTPLIVYF